ncbi:MAG: zinc ABC transporter substrate-binding protein [Syntrophaceae bacterium]
MNRIEFRVVLFVLILMPLVFAGPARAAGKVRVSVSVPPQAYFVERIGGDKVDVQVMLPGHSDHDSYEPTPQQLIRLAKAQIYVRVGVPGFTFETRHIDPALAKKKIKLITMSDGVKLLDDDPHIWAAPSAVRQAAFNIYKGLSGFDPAGSSYYKRNLDSFVKDIDALDREIKALLKGKEGGTFLIYHPALAYFAAEYKLRQVSIETEGKSPSASHIRGVIDLARSKGIKKVLIQKGFDRKNAKTIAAEIGGSLEEIDPLDRNWLSGTRNTAIKVSGALRK